MRLMITCPKTGKAVPTPFGCGDLASFNSNSFKNNYVQCAVCGEMHPVDDETIKVFPDVEF